jgi:tRNA threonylcarbamoyladenosine biosynthesis protein TsaE
MINTADEMQALGMELAKTLHGGDVVFFQGELGAGKTTLIRGILRGWHYTGFVKSPSYSLIELYSVGQWQVVHVDLYRLASPQEIQHIGLSDYLTKDSILLIEWPEKAEEFLPKPTWRCQIAIINHARQIKIIN